MGFGAGIAQGYATLGQIGFSERSGYTAIGTVCNVAARLCAEAKDGQILLGQLVNVALKGSVATEQLGPLTLKGLSQPVVAYNVPLGAIQPALRVIEGGPQSCLSAATPGRGSALGHGPSSTLSGNDGRQWVVTKPPIGCAKSLASAPSASGGEPPFPVPAACDLPMV